MDLNEIARREAEYLRALPATVTLSGATITLAQAHSMFVVECLGEDRFLIGHEPPPMTGGFQTQVTSQPRVEVNRKELLDRARAWARSNRLAS
jgi:hypothetical protein